MEEIEASRLRRGWPQEYGARGADAVRASISLDLPASVSRMLVPFSGLRSDPLTVAREIAAFADLEVPQDLEYRLAGKVRSA